MQLLILLHIALHVTLNRTNLGTQAFLILEHITLEISLLLQLLLFQVLNVLL